MIFAGKKLQNSGILHDFCPKNAQILHNNCPKNMFSRNLGGMCPPAPSPGVDLADVKNRHNSVK